jgi:hypothetical protein
MVWGKGITIVEWWGLWQKAGCGFDGHQISRKNRKKDVSLENCVVYHVPKHKYDDIFSRFLSGETDSRIAESYDVNAAFVRELRKKYGVKRNAS